MNIADRIQALRKQQGLSQEELADRLGISRQAVSKWESGQSTPDLERIVALSQLLGVSTDHLLLGSEPTRKEAIRPQVIFAIVSTVMNVFGLLFGSITWYEEQTAGSILGGAVFLVLGCMLCAVGRFAFVQQPEPGLYRAWWRVNIWLVLFSPLAVFYNLLLSGIPAPYPLLSSGLISYVLFWLIYIGTSLLVMYRTRERG